VIGPANFSLEMFKLKLDVGEWAFRSRASGHEGADMRSIHRSILARALMAGVASLAFVMMGAIGVRAETVGGADGAPGAFCQGDDWDCDINGGDGESVSAGGNPAVAIGGNGGAAGGGGNGNGDGTGNGGNGAVPQPLFRRAVRLLRLRRQEARADTAAFLMAGAAVAPPRLARRLAVLAGRHHQHMPRAVLLFRLVALEAAPQRRPMR
jgi:hypothetical protein